MDRAELAAILTSSSKASAFPDLLAFLRQRAKAIGLDLSQVGERDQPTDQPTDPNPRPNPLLIPSPSCLSLYAN